MNLFLERGEMFNCAIPSFLGFLHTLYTLTLRLHQGFYGFSTQNSLATTTTFIYIDLHLKRTFHYIWGQHEIYSRAIISS